MSLRFPVAVWQDAAGTFTARILDGANCAAYDLTAAAALAQLEKYLAWGMRKGTELVETADFYDLELRDHRVRIRPEYRANEIAYPVPTTFHFRVICAHGRRRDGTRHCVVPTLGIRLSYQVGDPIDELISEALTQALGKNTPQTLSRELMPAHMRLDAVHVRRRSMANSEFISRWPALESIATLLGVRRRGVRNARAIGREEEIRKLEEHLAAGNTNILLLGEAGTGKSTVLAEAIRRIERAPKPKRDADSSVDSFYDDIFGEPRDSREKRQFWRTSGQRLIAGMKYLGQWEERCERAISELAETNSVFCVENLLELVRVGGCEPGNSLAAFFQPYLKRGELHMVAEATSAELDACRRLLPGFADSFQIVRIPEFSPANSRLVLERLLTEGARNLKRELEPGLADLVYRLFRRFQPYAAFPGRSVAFVRHFLDDIGRAESATPSSPSSRPLTQFDVLAEFQKETGLPQRLLRDDLPLPHSEVLQEFRQAVLGQEAACQAAAGIVTTLKTGLNDPARPLGVLLFCGPTGVGKTEMAKALARYLFGGQDKSKSDSLLRLDMSEYAGPGAAQRLLMSSDGSPSDFIKRARRHPFAVVLLDEIEKGAPEVHDILLGMLDEGRLTDRYGRATTFRSSVIVMTSNLGAERSQSVGFDAEAQPPFERIVLQAFRPEFINRIDAIIAFEPLRRDTIVRLVVRELESIQQREGIARSNLRLTWNAAVIEHLASAGVDLRYGARPLQRAIERLVVAPLARYLLSQRATNKQEIRLELAEGEIVVQ